MIKAIQYTLFLGTILVIGHAFYTIYNSLVTPLKYEFDPIAQAIGSEGNTALKLSCVKVRVRSIYDLRCRVIPTKVLRF